MNLTFNLNLSNMKKTLLILSFLGMFSAFSFGQLIDEKNVTVTMDLQPILQLNMSTSDQVDFVFDDIRDYYGGIIKYAATILKVSSSVNWDLYAVGTSQGNSGANFWDQQMSYSNVANPNSVSALPLSLLELHQYEANQYIAGGTGPQKDYHAAFSPANIAAPGVNSIFYSTTPYTAPLAGDKYIQGSFGTGVNMGAPGGSYLTANPPAGTFSDYYFTIDYRILPGLPAIFKNAGTSADVSQALIPPLYAEPGVYTMNCKYILLEDQ
jgi:hypothetical protein